MHIVPQIAPAIACSASIHGGEWQCSPSPATHTTDTSAREQPLTDTLAAAYPTRGERKVVPHKAPKRERKVGPHNPPKRERKVI